MTTLPATTNSWPTPDLFVILPEIKRKFDVESSFEHADSLNLVASRDLDFVIYPDLLILCLIPLSRCNGPSWQTKPLWKRTPAIPHISTKICSFRCSSPWFHFQHSSFPEILPRFTE